MPSIPRGELDRGTSRGEAGPGVTAIRGILFDMDGVVVHQRLDFPAIKREIFGDTEGFILERMATPPPVGLAGRGDLGAARDRRCTLGRAHGRDPCVSGVDGHERSPPWPGDPNSRRSVELVLGRLGFASIR